MRKIVLSVLFLIIPLLALGYVPPLDLSKIISDSEIIFLGIVQGSFKINESKHFLTMRNVVVLQILLKGNLPLGKPIEIFTEEFNPKAANELPYDRPLKFPGTGIKILVFIKKASEGSSKGKFVLTDNLDGLWKIKNEKFEDPSRPPIEKLKEMIEKAKSKK